MMSSRTPGELGIYGFRNRADRTYDHLSIALSAVEAGRGVALAAEFLCERRLAAGSLCMPFDLRAPSPATYHQVCRPEGLADPRITAFRDWLVDALA